MFNLSFEICLSLSQISYVCAHIFKKVTLNKVHSVSKAEKPILNCKAPNTTIAEFANTVDPDETAHLDLQCLPSSL